MLTLLLLLLLGVTLAVLIKLQRKSTISPLLSLSLLFCYALWYLMPILLALVLWGSDTDYGYQLKLLGMNYDGYVQIGIIETGAFLVVCLLLLRIRRPSFRFLTDSRLGRQEFDPKFIIGLLVVGFIAVAYVQISTKGIWGADYLERNAFLVTGESERVGISGLISILNDSVTCFAYACVLMRWRDVAAARLIQWLSWGWVAYSTAVGVLTGARIVLLAPVVLYIMRKTIAGPWSKKQVVQIIGVGLVTMVIGAPLAILIGDIRGTAEISSESLQSEADDQPDKNVREQVTHSLGELVIKFNSPLCGQILLETGSGYGFQPYIGSLLAIIPRAIQPDKPVPGSVTNDYSGHPTRIVAILQGMERTMGNVQVSPAAIAIWQLRYPGLILLIAFNLFALCLLNSLLLSSSVLCRSLAFYMVGIPAFYTLFSSPDSVIQLTERICVVLVLGAVAQRFLTSGGDVKIPRGVVTHPGTS